MECFGTQESTYIYNKYMLSKSLMLEAFRAYICVKWKNAKSWGLLLLLLTVEDNYNQFAS